eukprot:852973-Prymnesium_polylepis.1
MCCVLLSCARATVGWVSHCMSGPVERMAARRSRGNALAASGGMVSPTICASRIVKCGSSFVFTYKHTRRRYGRTV